MVTTVFWRGGVETVISVAINGDYCEIRASSFSPADLETAPLMVVAVLDEYEKWNAGRSSCESGL